MKAYCQDTCSVDPQLSSKAQPVLTQRGLNDVDSNNDVPFAVKVSHYLLYLLRSRPFVLRAPNISKPVTGIGSVPMDHQ